MANQEIIEADEAPEDENHPEGWMARIRASFQKFWSDDLPWVVLGGTLGGMTLPALNVVLEGKISESALAFRWDNLLWFGVFGLFSAGFTVYVLMDNRGTNLRRLFFFSLITGLTFPSVLADATGKDFGIDQQSSENRRLANTPSGTPESVKRQTEVTRGAIVEDLPKADKKVIAEDTKAIIEEFSAAVESQAIEPDQKATNSVEELQTYLRILEESLGEPISEPVPLIQEESTPQG